MSNSQIINKIENNMDIFKSDIIITEADSIILELLSSNKIKSHIDTSRHGLTVRRIIRTILTAIVTNIPVAGWIYAIWFMLSEGGLVRASEKRTFIRFQGLTDMHIKRVTNSTNSNFYSHEFVKIKDNFSNMNYSDLADAYYELIGREVALVIVGYIRTENNDSLDDDTIDSLSSDIMKFQFSTAGNTGLWNRFKTARMSIPPFGIVTAIFPLQSYLGHFHQLNKVNRTSKPVEIASEYLKKYLKSTNKQIN